MSEKKQQNVFPTSYILIISVILALIVYMFFSTGIFQMGLNQTQDLSFILGLFVILLLIVTLLRLVSHPPLSPQRVTLTVLQCVKCAFKNIRNFQPGDYIPKLEGTCPSCGGPFRIEAIYMEEKTVKRRLI